MRIYRKEYEDRLEYEAKEIEYVAWLHGVYIVNAIQTALNPKKAPYPENPFRNEMKNEQYEDSEISAIRFGQYAEAYNKAFVQKVGESVV